MTWDINLNPEGQDPDLEAITTKTKRAADWASKEAEAALTDVLKTVKMSKGSKRIMLDAEAGYLGAASAMVKLIETAPDGGKDNDVLQAAKLLAVAKFIKRMAENQDKIEEF